MVQVALISGSASPNRTGAPVVEWLATKLRAVEGVTLDVVDLQELALPFCDEPNLPRLQQYTHQHTKDWSARVAAADAFVFVTPEYNGSFPAILKNALDYLHHEWRYKPAGVVTYGGGLSAGFRGAQALRQVLAALYMVPIQEAVAIPFVKELLARGFTPTPAMEAAADTMIREMLRAQRALSTLHMPEPQVEY